jgi:ornithine cyclodeaminase
MRLLTEAELNQVPMSILVGAVRAQILADAEARAFAPPRHRVDFGEGGLTFTCGGNDQLAGFRVYDTFPKPEGAEEDQVVIAYDRKTARLKGLFIGERLGALRTGCLGGVAADVMTAQKPIKKLGLIGTGTQAETQLLAIAAVREIEQVQTFSRNKEKRTAFANQMAAKLGVPVLAVDEPREAVDGADFVVLATNATVPVIETSWLAPGCHLTTLGPKFKNRHELPLDILSRVRSCASDSPQQIGSQGENHMFYGQALNIQHLGNYEDADGAGDLSLFLSAGLAGTEVALLSAALDATA